MSQLASMEAESSFNIFEAPKRARRIYDLSQILKAAVRETGVSQIGLVYSPGTYRDRSFLAHRQMPFRLIRSPLNYKYGTRRESARLAQV